MSILNNITEGQTGPPEASMAEHRAGMRKRRPTHPGKILSSSLEALGMTPYAAAPLLGVSRMMLSKITNEKAAVTPEMALRLGKFFDNGAELWLGLQADVDLWDAREKLAIDLAKIKPAKKAAA